MLQQRIEQDLKTALLAGDTLKVSVLRSLKSAITYAEVARGVKGTSGLADQDIVDVLSKEAKKRQESAEIFAKNDQQARADQELSEYSIIEQYLPPMATEAELQSIIEGVVGSIEEPTVQMMGKVIAEVKEKTQARIDGGLLARLVKERLQK